MDKWFKKNPFLQIQNIIIKIINKIKKNNIYF